MLHRIKNNFQQLIATLVLAVVAFCAVNTLILGAKNPVTRSSPPQATIKPDLPSARALQATISTKSEAVSKESVVLFEALPVEVVSVATAAVPKEAAPISVSAASSTRLQFNQLPVFTTPRTGADELIGIVNYEDVNDEEFSNVEFTIQPKTIPSPVVSRSARPATIKPASADELTDPADLQKQLSASVGVKPRIIRPRNDRLPSVSRIVEPTAFELEATLSKSTQLPTSIVAKLKTTPLSTIQQQTAERTTAEQQPHQRAEVQHSSFQQQDAGQSPAEPVPFVQNIEPLSEAGWVANPHARLKAKTPSLPDSNVSQPSINFFAPHSASTIDRQAKTFE